MSEGMPSPDEWWASLAPWAKEEVQKNDVGFVAHYDIRLPLVKAVEKNLYDSQAPMASRFRIVGPASPVTWRDATEKLAYYFRRELEYDSPPYTAAEVENWDLAKDRVLVFVKDTVLEDWEDYLYFIGAVGVRWREWDNAPHGWAIAWAWLHPYERRKGHLSKSWPFLLEKFPNFRVEAPISDAMIGFLKKMEYKEPEPQFLGKLLDGPHG